MDHAQISKQIFSGDVVELYPIKAEGERYEAYRQIIDKACSFSNGNFVLELCCGTSKYFHMLRNMDLYVGVDISKEMLDKAEKHLIGNFQLIECDINEFESMMQYDFIFSIGTIGEYLPLTRQLLGNMISWLHIGGLMFFTIVDKDAFVQRPDLTYDWSDCYMSYDELDSMMKLLPTIKYSISRHEDNKHVHLICKLQKI